MAKAKRHAVQVRTDDIILSSRESLRPLLMTLAESVTDWWLWPIPFPAKSLAALPRQANKLQRRRHSLDCAQSSVSTTIHLDSRSRYPGLLIFFSSTAVARGAILRASNKELGPVRKSSCSYGFLRSEPYEPKEWPAHQVTKPRTDPVDGEKYVHNTIDWLFQKVCNGKHARDKR
jgi:hypothetical protein